MSSLFLPDGVFQNITDIDPAWLIRYGIRGLALDVDNTIAKYSEAAPAQEIVDWLRRVGDTGIRAVIVSNSSHANRVPDISRVLGIEYLIRAGKPSRRGFRWAAEILGVAPEHLGVIGDQIFTDVLGAKRAGCQALIVYPRGMLESPWFRVRRCIETPFIRLGEKTMRRLRP